MQTVLTLSAADWPRVRLARSALWETTQALRTLRQPRRRQFHLRWLDQIGGTDLIAQVPALAAIMTQDGPVWVPDFLAAPPPETGFRSIEEELAIVAEYPAPRVREDLQHCLDSQPTLQRSEALQPLIQHPVRGRAQLIAELRLIWVRIVEPFWPTINRLIADDIAYRSRQLARHGLGAVLAELHPNVQPAGDRIVVKRAGEQSMTLTGQGLLLMPSAFLRPDPVVVTEGPWPPALIYPARGLGNLWALPEKAPQSLANLLGANRAQLLIDLADRRSTSALATRHGLSPAATSAHLKRLAGAGLVDSTRAGKEVLYARTDLGTALVTANPN